MAITGYCLLAMPCSGCAHAPEAGDSDKIKDYLTKEAKRFNIAKIDVAAVAADGNAAQMLIGKPLPANAAFYLGPVSKPWTARGILSLVDEGKLSLDGDIQIHIAGKPVPNRHNLK